MKHLNPILILLIVFGTWTTTWAQDRFLFPVFEDVTVTKDLTYGENYTILYISAPGIEAPVLEDLKFDFYEPTGDTASNRPLVILMKTGNFLPIQTNGVVYGTKRDSATVEIATRLARMGYVVASIDYRLGWNPLADDQPVRALQLIQAAYRGLQDSRTAIRYFRKDFQENNNSFGIDTSRITLWGMGTGGYVSMITATFDNIAKAGNTEKGEGKFLIPPPLPGAGLPMVNEIANGDIYGTSEGFMPIDAPPFEAGDQLATPNHVGFSSHYHLTVNGAGALGDISWLEAGQTPIIAYHVPTDPNAPYGDNELIVPTTGETVVRVQGSHDILSKVNADTIDNNAVFDGVESMFEDYPDFGIITQKAKEASAKAAYGDINGTYTGHEYLEGLYPFNRPPNQGDPWNWWEPARWDTVTVPNQEITFHQLASLSNPDMSPEKGRRYIDTIMWYFLPRSYLAHNLGEWMAIVGIEELINPEEVGLTIAPNPASEQVFLRTDAEHPMREVLLFDLNGRLLQAHTRIEASQFEVPRRGIPPGMYVLKVSFDEGVTAKRILFK